MKTYVRGAELSVGGLFIYLLMICVACIGLGLSCVTRGVVVPADKHLHTKADFPCVPEHYYCISEGYWDEVQLTIMQCEALLLLQEN